MNNNLHYEFTVDKEKQTVFIQREFAAEQSLVWDAYTQKDILDQWWAPKPFVSKTKYMNFEEGGKRFYAMVGPDGVEHWSIQTYSSIHPKTHFKMYNAFSDKDENPELPGSEWDFTFSEQGGKTMVSILIYNESRARMERMVEMGFKEGFSMTMINLEELLEALSQK